MKIVINMNTTRALSKDGYKIISNVMNELDQPMEEWSDDLFNETIKTAELQTTELKNVDIRVENDELVYEIDDAVLFAVMRIYKRVAGIVNPMIRGFVALGKIMVEEGREIQALITQSK